MTVTHKVIAAAAFVTRETGAGQLVYAGAPVPADATNLEELIDGGFVEAIDDEEFGGHPSDIPEGYLPAPFPDAPVGASVGATSPPPFPIDGTDEEKTTWISAATIPTVQAYVTEYPDSAAELLAAETRRGEAARSTLVVPLTKLAEGS